MSEWECEHPGCHRKAVGLGSAFGLRAIGWYFATGPRILCPWHHPGGVVAAHQEAAACQLEMARKLAPDQAEYFADMAEWTP